MNPATYVELISIGLQDQGEAFTCRHANGGINVTMAVLGPYSPKDKVELLWDKISDPTRTSQGPPLLADYRRARADTPYLVSHHALRMHHARLKSILSPAIDRS